MSIVVGREPIPEMLITGSLSRLHCESSFYSVPVVLVGNKTDLHQVSRVEWED